MAALFACERRSSEGFTTVPYRRIYEEAYTFTEAVFNATEDPAFGNLKSGVTYTVLSSVTGAPVEGLELHVQLGDQTVPVPVTEDGVVQIPLNREWADANAMVVSNQPKGTLNLGVKLRMSGSLDVKNGVQKYRQLFLAADVILRVAEEMATAEGEMLPEEARDLDFIIPLETGNDQAEVRVLAKEGPIVYRANDQGVVSIPFRYPLFRENPEVEVPDGTYSIGYDDGVLEEATSTSPPFRMKRSLEELLPGFAVTVMGLEDPARRIWLVLNPAGTHEAHFRKSEELIEHFHTSPPERKKLGIVLLGAITHLEDPEAAKEEMPDHKRRLISDPAALAQERTRISELTDACRKKSIDLWINTDLKRTGTFVNLNDVNAVD